MQKQEASILSIELTGFCAHAEHSAPEQLQTLMDNLYQLLDTTTRMHHGTIDRYTGESMLTVYANGKSSRSSAMHALDSALEITEQLKGLNKEHHLDPPIGFKTGIATGNILLTRVGSDQEKQSALMGEAVTHAIRISQFAEDGQVLTDDTTAGAAEGQYDFQRLEPIPLTGGTGALAIFEVTGKKRKKLDLKTVSERRIVSEMVGRSREAEQLEGLIKNLVNGKGSIVNIVGKAGIGKSRLIAEMKVQPVMEKVQMLEGRALSNGKNLSFHPVIHLIRSWAGITENDAPTLSAEKLHQGIKQIIPGQADEVFAFLATMMGLPLTGKHAERVKGIEGEALEKLILKNLRDLIIAATGDKPRIYLIEDMHWSDSSSITLFESLYKLSQRYPVMFINVMRPGYRETGDYILKYLVDNFPGDHTTIHINPLTSEESVNLICNLLRKTSLPAEVEGLVIRKTEGNPFFIEETLRSFIDDGIVELNEGRFVVSEKINEVNIPETINDAILSRIDKLDEKTRELLNTASVMGRNFYYKVLEEATDTIEELDSRLAYLSDIQLISESKTKQDIEYLFKHALSQQLTYDALLQESRKELHRKIAGSIEKVFAGNISEFYGTLVYHYSKSGDQPKTIHYLVLAGDESRRSGASREALNFYQQALDLMPEKRKQDPGDREIRDLNLKVAAAKHTLGENALAVEHYEMIIRKYFHFKFAKTEKGLVARGVLSMLLFMFMINYRGLFFKRKLTADQGILMQLFNNWGYAYIHHNSKQFAFKGLKAMVYTSLHDIRGSLPALSFFIDAAILFNFTGISIATARKIIDHAKWAGVENDPQTFINYRMTRIIQHYFTGRWQAEEDFERTYREGLRIGKYWTTLTYIYYSGMCAIESGRYADFSDHVRILQELAESLDITYSMILSYRLSTMGYLRFGKLEELQEVSGKSVEFIQTTGDDANLFMVYCMRAQGCTYLGKPAEARHALDFVEDKVGRHSRVPIFHSQYLLSCLEYEFLRLGSLERGTLEYRSSIRKLGKLSDTFLARSKKNPATLTTAYLMKARLTRLLNKNGRSLAYMRKAIRAGEKYDGRLILSRAYLEAGKFLSDPAIRQKQLNGLTAEDYFEKAGSLFREMDLEWDMEQLKKSS